MFIDDVETGQAGVGGTYSFSMLSLMNFGRVANVEINGRNCANKKAAEMPEKKSKLVGYFETRKLIFLLIITATVSLGGIWFISDLYENFRLTGKNYALIVTVMLWVVSVPILLLSYFYAVQRKNINKQEKAIDKIRNPKQFLDNILESLTYPFYVIDVEDYSVKMANSAALCGKLPSDVKCFMLTHNRTQPCDEPDHVCVIKEINKTGKPAVVNHQLCDKDSHCKDVEVHGYPVYDQNGRISQVIEYIMDVTDRTQMEAALRSAKDKAELLFKLVPSGIFTVDKNQVITSVNDRWCQMTGFSPDEIVGKPCSFCTLESCSKCSLYTDDVKKPVIDKECKIKTKDGKILSVTKNIDCIRDSAGNIIGGIESFEDITADKKNEDKQQKLMDELESTNRELRDFAYIVSHDLKAPLRGITTLAEWLSQDYSDKFDEQGKENLRLLLERVSRMQKMIEGILQYSRVGRVREDKVLVDTNKIVTDAIDTIAPPDNVEIRIDNELPVIPFEPTRITQVFQNLLSNAVKYMDKPKGLVTVGCTEENGFWKFAVTDNGCGIDAKHFDKIFQLFQTLAPRDKFDSTGIGLTVVKKIIELYGGKIWVESKPGQGSTFYFTIPKEHIGVRTNEKLEAHLVG